MNYTLSLNDDGEPQLWFDAGNNRERSLVAMDSALALNEAVAVAILNDFYGAAIAQSFGDTFAQRPNGFSVGEPIDVGALTKEIGLYDTYLDDVARLDDFANRIDNDPALRFITDDTEWGRWLDQLATDAEIGASWDREA
jgi:hypothetical protein